jgi:hypothetical protein
LATFDGILLSQELAEMKLQPPEGVLEGHNYEVLSSSAGKERLLICICGRIALYAKELLAFGKWIT